MSELIFIVGVTQPEAQMLHQGVYYPKIVYLLRQTFLTDKHVQKIELTSLPKIIAKCGYNKNMHLGI